jgi:antitoxin component HigA of HigAB toxin-antitoxin module
MSAVVKAHHTKRTSSGGPYLFSFKRTTPRRILADAKKRYAPYLNIVDDESVPIAETEWYQQMSKEMTPARFLKTYREISGYSQARLGEIVGIPASRISDFETGQRSISKEMAKRFAELFKVSPGVFI